MSTRTTVLAAVGGLTAGVVLATAPFAAAGHANSVLEADLSGRQEVATDAADRRNVGDPNGRGEIYVFGIDEPDGQRTTLCYVLVVDGIAELEQAPNSATNPSNRVAHLHEGAPGTNGPAEVNLAWPQGGQAADCLTEGEPGKGLETGEVAEILDDPGDYYVNVHNDEHPSGAIRGQLEAQHTH